MVPTGYCWCLVLRQFHNVVHSTVSHAINQFLHTIWFGPLEREATQVPHYAVKLTPAHRHSLAPLSVVLAHTTSSPFKAVSNIAGVAYSEPVLGASELLDGSVSRRSRAATIHHCMGEE